MMVSDDFVSPSLAGPSDLTRIYKGSYLVFCLAASDRGSAGLPRCSLYCHYRVPVRGKAQAATRRLGPSHVKAKRATGACRLPL